MRIRADFHSHAIGDGRFGDSAAALAEKLVDTAAEVGLDVLAVTDHDDLRPGLLAEEYAARNHPRLLVVPGMEITTDENHHVVAVGLREPIPRWRPLAETIARIRNAGAICILPHPFFPHLRERRDVDAVERYNARYGDFEVGGDGRVAIVANSDAHSADELRRSPRHTVVEVDRLDWADVAAAIRAGRTTPV